MQQSQQHLCFIHQAMPIKVMWGNKSYVLFQVNFIFSISVLVPASICLIKVRCLYITICLFATIGENYTTTDSTIMGSQRCCIVYGEGGQTGYYTIRSGNYYVIDWRKMIKIFLAWYKMGLKDHCANISLLFLGNTDIILSSKIMQQKYGNWIVTLSKNVLLAYVELILTNLNSSNRTLEQWNWLLYYSILSKVYVILK